MDDNLIIINNLCLFSIIAVIIANRKYFFGGDNGGYSFIWLWLFLTLFSTFYTPIGGDSYTGIDGYWDYVKYGVSYHGEDIYLWLRRVISNSYRLYRFAIWGFASLFVCLSAKKIGANPRYTLLLFTVVSLIPCYYYLRNVTGFAVLYYVTLSISSYKYESTKKLIQNILLWGALLVLSYYLHNSMPLYYGVVLFALLIPLNKITLILFAVIVPLMGSVFSALSSWMISSIFSIDLTSWAENYMEVSEGYDWNINGLLLHYFWLLPYFVLLIYSALTIKKDDSRYDYSKPMLMASIILFSLSFFFSDRTSFSLQLRMQNTAFFPLTLFLVSHFEDKKDKEIYRFSIYAILIYTAYMLITSFE